MNKIQSMIFQLKFGLSFHVCRQHFYQSVLELHNVLDNRRNGKQMRMNLHNKLDTFVNTFFFEYF